MSDIVMDQTETVRLVGFFCALRRSELVGLAVEDLDRRPDGWTVNIRRSKTDPYGVGQTVKLPELDGLLCPTRALFRWLAAASIGSGPIFRRFSAEGTISTMAVPASQVGSILRSRAQQADVPTTNLSAHSLRSGFAVSASRAGISAAQIQATTRHRTLAGLVPYVRDAGGPRASQLIGMIEVVSGDEGVAGRDCS